MPACGLKYGQHLSLEENTLKYFNAKRRIAPSPQRTVRESRELRIPKEYLSDYCLLKRLISEGKTLKPYLSRDIQNNRADENDGLLNHWGIQHLHFRPGGTRDVLFVKITDKDVFVIQSLPHGQGHSDVWVNTQLLQILHDNWPEVAAGKVVGVHAESLTTDAMVSLRDKNLNFAVATSDGIAYLSPGGGVTSSGHCFFDVCDTDKIFAHVDNWQKQVEANEPSFRAALDISPSEELSIKMKFEKGECWLWAPAKGVRFAVTSRQMDNQT